MLRTMTIRLYPNRQQEVRLAHYLFVGRVLYNRSLEARIHWYKTSGKLLTYNEQCGDLTELRAADVFWRVPREVGQDALRRLDKAYRAFFRRMKAGEKPGFPRFKGRNRWDSFTINRCRQVVRGHRIRVSGVNGLIRARNIRPIAGAIIEQCIVRKAGRWFCQLIIDAKVVASADKEQRPAVGIDLGLKHFAAMSDGTMIANPVFGRKAERTLAHANRNISRAKKGCANRGKRIARLHRVYFRVTNLRNNFTHQESRRIANKYGVIAVEAMTIRGMARGRLAKSILDACWSQFTSQLTYKAEEAGGVVVRVNPAGTSQECSQCGKAVPKDLSVRVHSCDCGCVLDRDLNAARNILHRALDQHRAPIGRCVMPVEGAVAPSLNQEVLTLRRYPADAAV